MELDPNQKPAKLIVCVTNEETSQVLCDRTGAGQGVTEHTFPFIQFTDFLLYIPPPTPKREALLATHMAKCQPGSFKALKSGILIDNKKKLSYRCLLAHLYN